MNELKIKLGICISGVAIILWSGMAAGNRESFLRTLGNVVNDMFLPVISCGTSHEAEGLREWLLHKQMRVVMPLYGVPERVSTVYAMEQQTTGQKAEREKEQTMARSTEQGSAKEAQGDSIEDGRKATVEDGPESEQEDMGHSRLLTYEEMAGETHESIDLEPYHSYEELVKTFYTIDTNTMAGSDQLNLDKLLSKDMRVLKEEAAPQILIYHTHSQEAYADSVPGDPATSVVGVGEYLARILQEEWHDTLHSPF